MREELGEENNTKVLTQLPQDCGETDHNVKRVDAGHVHGREQHDKVSQETAEGSQQSRSRAVADRAVLHPVNVAATVHLSKKRQ